MTVPTSQPLTTTGTVFYATHPPTGERAYVEINAAPDGERPTNIQNVRHDVTINNIRTTTKPIGLDITGFEVRTIPSKFSEDHNNFLFDERVKSEYYAEVIQSVKDATGAKDVVIFDHTIRRRRPGQVDDTPDKRQPVARVHIDQTPWAAERRVVRHTGDKAAEYLRNRYQIINFWRPIEHPAEDHPLALVAYPSIDSDKDLVPTTLVYPGPTPNGETYSVSYNPAHEWYYQKAQTVDEATFIKCYDSKEGVARCTPHTAFNDPGTDKEAPLRQSIEVRCLVFY